MLELIEHDAVEGATLVWVEAEVHAIYISDAHGILAPLPPRRLHDVVRI
jgi:hypothetical protein